MSAAGRGFWLALIVVATLAYYGWTAACSFEHFPAIGGRGSEQTDHFNLLSHGFRQGHLYLDAEVPAALAALPNPYDPVARKSLRVLHDASYYRGKYYIYFGPAPVVTLFLPFSVLAGRDLPLPWAVWVYCSIGYLAMAATFLALQRRYFPAASLWSIAAGLIALGGANLAVALLRRPNVWEVSAAAGFCFFALSLACLATALHSARPLRWSLAGGLALGLAVASRPTYIVCSVMFVAPLLLARYRGAAKAIVYNRAGRPARARPIYGWTSVLAAAAGTGAIVLALLAYNQARFGNALEFGQKYQLSGIEEGAARHFGPQFVWFNLRVYFFSALRWLPTFPFHDGIKVPPEPAGYGGYEYALGLFTNLPFSLLSLVPIARWRRGPASETTSNSLTPIIAAVTTAVAAHVALLLFYFGTCIRYMVDFTPAIVLLAALGVLQLEAALHARAVVWAVRAVALVLALASACVAAAAVVYLYSPADTYPHAYQRIARALNYPYFRTQERRWPNHQPMEISFALPAARPRRSEPLVLARRGAHETASVALEYLDETKVRFVYHEAGSDQRTASAPYLIAADTPQALRLQIGGSHADFDGRFSRLRAQLNGEPVWDLPVVSLDAFPANVALAPKDEFSGKILSVHAIGASTFAEARLGGARIRLTFDPAMVGRSFPLAASGRSGAGDLLFLSVPSTGKIVFGYDHWGHALLLSPELPAAFDQPHVIEFWMPATNREIAVKLDGQLVWRQPATAYPASPATYHVGTNPIGGTTCEAVLEHGVIEAQQLPPPGL